MTQTIVLWIIAIIAILALSYFLIILFYTFVIVPYFIKNFDDQSKKIHEDFNKFNKDNWNKRL